MTDPQGKPVPVDLGELRTHFTGLGDCPDLDTADTALPDSLRDMLATFAGRKVAATTGPLNPKLDDAGTTLTVALTCADQPWPAQATTTPTVHAVTVTVNRDGTVAVVLDGTFHGIAVTAMLTEDETGMITGAVRSADAGAFDLAALVGELAGGAVWEALRSGLDELALVLGRVAGFDYRLELKDSADPTTYAVTETGVATELTLEDSIALDIDLWLEDKYITGALHKDTPASTLDVTTLLGKFGLPTVDVPKVASIRDLQFTGGFGDIYELTLDLAGSTWPVGQFTIDDLFLGISYSEVEGFVARFSGTVKVGSVAFAISAAQVSGASGGWEFEGGLVAGEAVTVATLTDGLKVTSVPKALETLELTRLWLSYTTGTSRFFFTCRGCLEITDGVTMTVGATIDYGSTGAEYGGTLAVDDYELDLVFDSRTGAEGVIAAYKGSGQEGPVDVRDWVGEFSRDLAAVIPEGLRVDLLDAKVFRVKSAAGQTSLAVGFDLSADLDLSKLPLVGGFLSEVGTLGIDDLQVLYSTGVIDATTARAVNTLLEGANVQPIPEQGLKSGLAVQAALRLGSELVPVALGLPAGQPTPPTTGAVVADAVDSRPASNSTGVWVRVQKQLGVLQVNRIGLIYQHNALLVALDAAVTLGPLTLSFDGLGVGSPLEKFDPTFNLSGLGVSFTNPAVTVTGGLLHVPDPPKGIDFQYDGAAIVETKKFSLAAIGSYAQLTDTMHMPSLFVFAQLDVPIGEPPLVVTALMAGFGFNRKLTIPTAAQVPGFPLLVLDKPGQKAMDVLDVLEGRTPTPDGMRQQWIAPLEGNYWLAAGAQLTVFEVVTATVVLAAEFGQDLIFALLGTATLQLPLKDENAVTYVYAELGLEATLRPLDGIAQAQAQLSPASYVLTPDCHVTGGFAAAVWFGSNPHAGQFVVTLGGYHPAFSRPVYYPTVPRLGISWAVSSAVSLTARAYLAVTPSCAMAGTDLEVLFHWGPVKAWFTARADLLVSWRPFFFTADIAVSIGASVTISVLGIHKTVGASVGADLHLWGPPFGGTVTAHIVVFTVTIGFGDDGSGAQSAPLAWSEVAAMLPARDKVVTVTAVSGLDSAIPDEVSTSGKRWLVRARDLRFTTQSAVPASHLGIADEPLETAGQSIDVRPMNRTGLAGVHRLTVRHDDRVVDTTGWTITISTHNLPASLWGAPPAPFSHTPGAPSADVIPDQPVGYSIQAPRPVLADSRGVFPLSDYDDEEIPPGLSPLPQQPVENQDYVCTPDPGVMQRLSEIASDRVRRQRDAMYTTLSDVGLYTGSNDSMTELAAAATHLYSQALMVEKAGNPT
ncbi:DUF6603 domain-containing protein [Nocardia sp. NPDC050193]